MDTRTGTIHLFAESTPKPNFFKELGNIPKDNCHICKGTGVRNITASGKRKPCKCTNPK